MRRRREDVHDFIAMREERIESFFRKGRLSNQRDTHEDLLRRLRTLPNKKSARTLVIEDARAVKIRITD